jgi:hypothetical protein
MAGLTVSQIVLYSVMRDHLSLREVVEGDRDIDPGLGPAHGGLGLWKYAALSFAPSRARRAG